MASTRDLDRMKGPGVPPFTRRFVQDLDNVVSFSSSSLSRSSSSESTSSSSESSEEA